MFLTSLGVCARLQDEHAQRIGEKGSSPANAISLASLLSQIGETMKWTEEELEFLNKYYLDKGPEYCVKNLNRTYNAILLKASNLKLIRTARWTKEEIEFLVDNYINGPEYCAEKLNKTVKAVYKKAYDLKLTKSIVRWSEQDVQFLIDNYPNKGLGYCAEKLGRNGISIQDKAIELKLRSNHRYKSNIVYVVYFPDLFLYKVGITNNVECRIKQFGQPCVILKAQKCEPTEAAELERDLLKSVTLINTGALNNGNTETFTQTSKEIEEFIN